MPFPQRMLTYNGETKPITEWAKQFNVPHGTVRSRLDLGWTVERALTTPVDRRFSSKNAGRTAKDAPRPCPKLKKHTDGSAHVRWQSKGQRHWLSFGQWGTKEAIDGYRRFTLEWAHGMAAAKEIKSSCTVAELVELYLEHADQYYRKHGKRTDEYHVISSALGLFCSIAGSKLVAELVADDIRLLLAAAVDRGYYRKTCNGYRDRVLRCLKWGVGQTAGNGKPFVPVEVHYSLNAVPTLVKGRTKAPERKPKRSAKWEDVEATFPHLNPSEPRRRILEALVRFHWLTGMRSSDLLQLRPCDLDKTFPEWRYSPEEHKQEHTETELDYYLGPKARAIIEPLLVDCPTERSIFALPPRFKNGSQWWAMDSDAYAKMIKRACKRKGGKSWHPHQLRHSRATEVQRIYEDDEAAAKAIGDTPEVARRVYIDPSSAVKRRIARETG